VASEFCSFKFEKLRCLVVKTKCLQDFESIDNGLSLFYNMIHARNHNFARCGK
jgi:hypothetical protein